MVPCKMTIIDWIESIWFGFLEWLGVRWCAQCHKPVWGYKHYEGFVYCSPSCHMEFNAVFPQHCNCWLEPVEPEEQG